jgi:hypothetical protein
MTDPRTPKQEALNAFAKLGTIAMAVNDDQAFPDWTNSDQRKYYPWFWMDKPSKIWFGSRSVVRRLRLRSLDFGLSGLALCSIPREKAEYAAKQFNDIYEKFMQK